MRMVFDRAFENTLGHEGGYVDDPDDPGGATKYGVSLRFLRQKNIDIDGDGDIDSDDIIAITPEHAKEIYHDKFWVRYRYEEIYVDDIACKIFDLAVNVGPRAAAKIVQRAVNVCGGDLAVDGNLGSKSFAAINCIYAPALLAQLRQQAADFYRDLVDRRPTLEKYLKGWLRRAAS